jgi:hypothetical protein
MTTTSVVGREIPVREMKLKRKSLAITPNYDRSSPMKKRYTPTDARPSSLVRVRSVSPTPFKPSKIEYPTPSVTTVSSRGETPAIQKDPKLQWILRHHISDLQVEKMLNDEL